MKSRIDKSETMAVLATLDTRRRQTNTETQYNTEN